MSYQSIGLVLIFLIGYVASCFPLIQGQAQQIEQPQKFKRIAPEATQFERAEAMIDFGKGDDASKIFHEILQSDLKERTPRVVLDLNNEAVALYLSARSQVDRKSADALLLLARDCLDTAQTYAKQMNLSQMQVAVSYNQYMLYQLLGSHAKASHMLSIASRQRHRLNPTLPDGLLP